MMHMIGSNPIVTHIFQDLLFVDKKICEGISFHTMGIAPFKPCHEDPPKILTSVTPTHGGFNHILALIGL